MAEQIKLLGQCPVLTECVVLFLVWECYLFLVLIHIRQHVFFLCAFVLFFLKKHSKYIRMLYLNSVYRFSGLSSLGQHFVPCKHGRGHVIPAASQIPGAFNFLLITSLAR